ncbi:arsenate reductase [Neiella marina]|uniref:Arsenate reductase n=1 Tax=Neiella holothuriorum TaxID=2870530 RepID=A0ABS7EJZ6_9GAMM|nr:arsenate reductase [Neiella holothuriorum]MBW8192188.1 arsenate reductase [Neiella holothuriorum]
MSTQSATIYGISNCDTVRKARKWLEQHAIPHSFQDVREQPLEQSQLAEWAQQVGWEVLFNKRSTSYRVLSDEQKKGLDESSAIALILEQPTLMKRPVFTAANGLIVGFNEKLYAPLLQQGS